MSKHAWKRKIGYLLVIMLLGAGLLAGCSGKSETGKGEMRTELTSLEFVDLLGNGINLGNTMEAYGHVVLGTEAEVSAYETYWGQPVTTQEMITGMHEAGFDTLRVPVAWTNMMNYESGDYTINEAYLTAWRRSSIMRSLLTCMSLLMIIGTEAGGACSAPRRRRQGIKRWKCTYPCGRRSPSATVITPTI